MKKITISDLDGFTDICECEKMLGELKAGCTKDNGSIIEELFPGPRYSGDLSK